MNVPKLWVQASLSLNVQEIVNVITYKVIVLIYHTSGASENFFEFTPSIMVENALLESRTNITLIIDLVLLWPLNHVCLTKKIMPHG